MEDQPPSRIGITNLVAAVGLAFTTRKKLRTATSELSFIGTWCMKTQSKFEPTVRKEKKAGNLSSKFKDTLCILNVYNG